MSSGVVLNEDVHWVTFHSPYDFGYLVKLLTCKNLPETQTRFFDLIKVFCPVVYDIKHMMRFCDGLYGGLDKLAMRLINGTTSQQHNSSDGVPIQKRTNRKTSDSK
ncbi:hypothetical protein QQ045_028855 [Rhodiola kirilowii]